MIKICKCGCNQEFIQKNRNVNFIRGHKIWDETHLLSKICNKCKINKDVSFFTKNSTKHKYNGNIYTRYSLNCLDCAKQTIIVYRQNNKNKILKNKQNYKNKHRGEPRYHISEKISTWKYDRKGNLLPNDLTTDYLVELFEKQNGKCYYSGKEIYFGAYKKPDPFSASLEKLIPELGYVQGNVVWCSYFINTMKGNLKELEFYNLIQLILDYRKNAQ